MISQATARSISRPVKRWLDQGQSMARTVPVFTTFAFKSACNLLTDTGELIALVTDRIGDGPFNVVIDKPIALDSAVGSCTDVILTPAHFSIGNLEVDLDRAVVWEPSPAWPELRTRWQDRHGVRAPCAELPSIKHLHRLCARHARHSIFSLLGVCQRANTAVRANTVGKATMGKAILDRATSALDDLGAGWNGNQARLHAGAVALAGLGNGSTPAGDDFLSGVMLWAWLAHRTPGTFCRTIVEAAAPLTTTLSAAFLRAASRGQCSAAWHALLAALTIDTSVHEAASRILGRGATSGADALLGFLYFVDHGTRRTI